jgi:deoxyribose-phosphate aldolase
MLNINNLVASLAKVSSIKVAEDSLRELIPYIDLTLLNDECNWADIYKLIEKSQLTNVAALCIPARHIKQARSCHISTPIATVVNFPHGNSTLAEIENELNFANEEGAQEIDLVFPYKDYLNGEKEAALECIKLANDYCKQNNLMLKVILETGEYPSAEVVYEACTDILQQAGCSMLKTSTGKTEHGASLESVYAMAQAVMDSGKLNEVGIKVSGEIKTGHKALQYKRLVELVFDTTQLTKEQFRIGASSLLDELLNSIDNKKA